MAKKYSIINHNQVLEVFQEKQVVRRKDITAKYNCSVYLTRHILEDLIDQGTIELKAGVGYKLAN